MSESDIQALIHAHPGCLPIAEIDPMFVNPLPVCTELNTPAGPIDNFMVTTTGLPVLVECKLWRNPEGRREVIAQILDYAKELSRWSSSDLQREVNRRLKGDGNPLLDLVRTIDPALDETQFNDNLTRNLRRGRFLLLIVGDGIREGTEAIADYLQAHAGLHFCLGLVELPIYVLPNGDQLVVPRVLARTALVTRTVVQVPDGYACKPNDELTDAIIDPERDALAEKNQSFWEEFIKVLKLDDPEQRPPRALRQNRIYLTMPGSGTSWITVYRAQGDEVGVFLSSHRNTAGGYAMQVIMENWEGIERQLGGTARLSEKAGRLRPIDSRQFHPLASPEIRDQAFVWLAERVNTFVNVLRPLVRSAVADYPAQAG